MRRTEGSWHNFTRNSGNWTAVHQTVKPSCCTIDLEPESSGRLDRVGAQTGSNHLTLSWHKNATEVLYDATVALESHHQSIKHLGLLQTVCHLLLQKQNEEPGMWVKTHVSQSNPTQISNVSICTQIWCFDGMKFFLSLITLRVLLHNSPALKQLHVRGKWTHLYIIFTRHTLTGSLHDSLKMLQSTFETFQLLSFHLMPYGASLIQCRST